MSNLGTCSLAAPRLIPGNPAPSPALRVHPPGIRPDHDLAPLIGVNCRQHFNRKEAKKIFIPLALVLSVSTSPCLSRSLGIGLVWSPGLCMKRLCHILAPPMVTQMLVLVLLLQAFHPWAGLPCMGLFIQDWFTQDKEIFVGLVLASAPGETDSRTDIVPSTAQIMTRCWEPHPKLAPPGWAR